MKELSVMANHCNRECSQRRRTERKQNSSVYMVWTYWFDGPGSHPCGTQNRHLKMKNWRLIENEGYQKNTQGK